MYKFNTQQWSVLELYLPGNVFANPFPRNGPICHTIIEKYKEREDFVSTFQKKNENKWSKNYTSFTPVDEI
jgi:hypothetical protein